MSKEKQKRVPRKPRRVFIPGLFQGFGTYFRVLPIMFKHRLWPLQIIPALLSLILSSAMVVGFWFAGDFIAKWIDKKMKLESMDSAGEWYSDLLNWTKLDDGISAAAGAVVFVMLCVVFMFVHKHIILVLLSPLLGKLAEATYQRVMNDTASSPLTIGQSFSRGIRLNFSNLFKEVSLNIMFFACNLIPGFGQVMATTGLFLNQSRFLGYSLMDTAIEHKGYNVKESLDFVRRRNGHSAGIGAGYILLMFIPFIGWMFAPTFGTIAGTLVAIDEFQWDEENCKDC